MNSIIVLVTYDVTIIIVGNIQCLLHFSDTMVSSKLLVVISCALVVSGQRPARIGDDGKPLLNRPVLEECKKRKKKAAIESAF